MTTQTQQQTKPSTTEHDFSWVAGETARRQATGEALLRNPSVRKNDAARAMARRLINNGPGYGKCAP